MTLPEALRPRPRAAAASEAMGPQPGHRAHRQRHRARLDRRHGVGLARRPAPLGLVLLNAKPRYLLLTTNELDPVSYYVVGTIRLVWTKPLVWLIGAWYGERAIRWAERRWDARGRVLRPAQRVFGRWGWIVVLVTSSNAVCLLAGASGMPLLLFMGLAVLGTVARLVVIRAAGDVLERPIDWVIDVIVANRVLVVVLSITVVVGSILWERRRGRGQLGDLASLDEALDEADAERATGPDLGGSTGDESAAH